MTSNRRTKGKQRVVERGKHLSTIHEEDSLVEMPLPKGKQPAHQPAPAPAPVSLKRLLTQADTTEPHNISLSEQALPHPTALWKNMSSDDRPVSRHGYPSTGPSPSWNRNIQPEPSSPGMTESLAKPVEKVPDLPPASDKRFEELYPRPFVNTSGGIGHATYHCLTMFNIAMTLDLFWKDKLVWGQFTIEEGYAYGYLKAWKHTEHEVIPDGYPIYFSWRGSVSKPKDCIVPSGEKEITKTVIEFSQGGLAVHGTMRPLNCCGYVTWRTGGDGIEKFQSESFEFYGSRVPMSDVQPEDAEAGWDVFESGI